RAQWPNNGGTRPSNQRGTAASIQNGRTTSWRNAFAEKTSLLSPARIDQFVATARNLLQCFTRANRDGSRRITDDSCRLEARSRFGDGGAPRAQNSSNGLLGEFQMVRAGAIANHQQPPAKTLFDGMEVVANSEIRNLNKQIVMVGE